MISNSENFGENIRQLTPAAAAWIVYGRELTLFFEAESRE